MTGRARPDTGDLRACREMLRHLSHPCRLRDNAIARRILESSGQNGDQLPDELLVTLIKGALDSAFNGLSTRRLAIVRRCDMGGERYADVARSLAISERHAFRERDDALRLILANLVSARPVARASAKAAADALWFRVAHAQAMEQNGNWQAAADILERIGADLDVGSRSFVETCLVRLYAGAERFPLAERHLSIARRLVTRMGRSHHWRRAEVDVAAARLADATGDIRGANRLARCACAELQSWAHTSTESRIINALIDGLTLRAEGAYAEGDIVASARFASAALSASGKARFPDQQFVISAREAALMVRGQPDDKEFVACYSLATQAGLTRQAIVLAAHRAGFLRLAGHPIAARELLTPLVATARAVGIGEPIALVIYELAASNLESGALEAARSYLTEMHDRAVGSPSRQGYAELVAAKLNLAQRNFALALYSAECAESIVILMRRDRFLGIALRMQAEALEGLGREKQALKAMKRAIEVLTATGQTAGLCTAYHVLGRISGDAKYGAMARRLRVSRPTG